MQPTISTCFLCIALLFSATIFSQASNFVALQPEPAAEPAKRIFIRLYNEQGKRIGDGHLLYGNDTMIMLSKHRSIRKYHVSWVWFIKTRHQRIRDIAIGTGVGVGLLAIAWAAADRKDGRAHEWQTSPDGFATRLASLLFPPAGALTGTTTGVLVKRKTIWLYSDRENWKAARKLFFYR